MDFIKTLALVLVVGGILAVVYGGFSYTKDTQAAKIGRVELTVSDTRHVNIPLWMGVSTIVIGASIMLARR